MSAPASPWTASGGETPPSTGSTSFVGSAWSRSAVRIGTTGDSRVDRDGRRQALILQPKLATSLAWTLCRNHT
eukprot:scaffold1973_cov399-Prasinococcus_capsulatus_cf.AAC.30